TTVKVWDVATFREKATLRGHTLPVSCLAVSPDGKTVAAGGDAGKPGPGELILWDLEAGRQRRALSGIDAAVRSVAYSPDGTLLVGATAAGVVKVWDAKTGQVRAILPAPFAGPLAFTPDGRLLAAGHGDGPRSDPGPSRVTLWETA